MAPQTRQHPLLIRERPALVALLGFALLFAVFIHHFSSAGVQAYPYAKINMFSHSPVKLDNKLSANDEAEAERSFQQFINLNPESTVIGELKPNATDLDLLLMKNKIASTILSIQEMEKARSVEKESSSSQGSTSTGADCFIEIKRVERIPGKCQKVRDGLPICQSNGYMATNPDCS